MLVSLLVLERLLPFLSPPLSNPSSPYSSSDQDSAYVSDSEDLEAGLKLLRLSPTDDDEDWVRVANVLLNRSNDDI
jgi:hypothetical protein